MTATVVLIAETRSNFITALQKRYMTYVVRSGKKGIEAAEKYQADIVVLDAVSLGTNGERICKQLRNTFPHIKIIHLHPQDKTNSASPADTMLNVPITLKTLLMAIDSLTLTQETTVLQCGDFRLDIDRQVLMTLSEEVALTPKQSALVEVFFRHPNQTLNRKELMQEIWKTDYTGDTRTLNVHIRFVREILEKDPSNPIFIKTVRGIGYRFDISLKEKSDH